MAPAAGSTASKRKRAAADEKRPVKSVEEGLEKRRKLDEHELSSDGDESSEFVSADEMGGVLLVEDGSSRSQQPGEIAKDSNEDSDSQLDEGDEPASGMKPAQEKKTIGQMLENSRARVAEVMKGYSSRSIPAKSSDSEGDDEDDSEEDDAESAVEIQLVPDNLDVEGGVHLPISAVDRDSRRALAAETDAIDAPMESHFADSESGSTFNSKNQRLNAAEATVRQIRTERNRNAIRTHASGTKIDGKDIGAAPQHVVASRAEKKERFALARQRRQALAAQKKMPHSTTPLKNTVHSKGLPPRRQKSKTYKPKLYTQHQRRTAKRLRRSEEMQRAAREDPAPYMQMLKRKIVMKADPLEDGSQTASHEHRHAAKKARRAETKLRRFEQMVAKLA